VGPVGVGRLRRRPSRDADRWASLIGIEYRSLARAGPASLRSATALFLGDRAFG
jgi:hypothetical protein